MITTLPYHPPTLPGASFKRIIARPIPKEEHQTESGLLIPTDIGRICETAIVTGVCKDSAIKVGSKVMYKKIDRNNKEHLDTIEINREKLDSVYENEIWAVDNHPFNRIFVESISSLTVNKSGLLLPTGIKGLTQKGKVFRAPPHYSVKPDDAVEYRTPEQDIYPTIEIDGKVYDVLNEWDVFTVNGKVAPFRIIVKIDMAQQRIKRNSTADSKLLRSPLFQYMLFNMQCGEVTEIGEEAKVLYPSISVGDSIIIHHSIESQKYRLIRSEQGKHDVAYEYRIINAFDLSAREILGRIASRKDKKFVPFGKNVFFEWKFDLYDQQPPSAITLDVDTRIDQCHDLECLKSTIQHKKDDGFKKSMAKIRGLVKTLSDCKLPEQKDRYDSLESELNLAKREATRVASFLDVNHMVVCVKLGTQERVLVTYKELYPINILGKKFLIGYEDYVLGTIAAEAD